MQTSNEIAKIYKISQFTKIARPLIISRVSAGIPLPAEDYVEGRFDLNLELVKHPISTFYIRVTGDSMKNIGIFPNTLLIVDRAMETSDGHIVIARLGDELCIKRLSFGSDGKIRLLSENENYLPIEIDEEMDFEIWGRVVYSIQPH